MASQRIICRSYCDLHHILCFFALLSSRLTELQYKCRKKSLKWLTGLNINRKY